MLLPLCSTLKELKGLLPTLSIKEKFSLLIHYLYSEEEIKNVSKFVKCIMDSFSSKDKETEEYLYYHKFLGIINLSRAEVQNSNVMVLAEARELDNALTILQISYDFCVNINKVPRDTIEQAYNYLKDTVKTITDIGGGELLIKLDKDICILEGDKFLDGLERAINALYEAYRYSRQIKSDFEYFLKLNNMEEFYPPFFLSMFEQAKISIPERFSREKYKTLFNCPLGKKFRERLETEDFKSIPPIFPPEPDITPEPATDRANTFLNISAKI